MRRARRLWLWILPAGMGVAGAVGLSAAFALALRGAAGEPLGTPPPAPKAPTADAPRPGRRLVVILGDSLARGTGDPSGRGWALDVLDEIRRRVPADASNLAVNGWESENVRRQMESSNVREIVARAGIILLSVGGNDLSHAVPRTMESAAAAVGEVERSRTAFAANLRGILRTIREVNPSAPIYLLGLYDPFQVPGVEGRLGSSVILQWNSLVSETALAFENVHVVPTFDLFQGRTDRLAADRFHPNREGYAAIAARAIQLLPKTL